MLIKTSNECGLAYYPHTCKHFRMSDMEVVISQITEIAILPTKRIPEHAQRHPEPRDPWLATIWEHAGQDRQQRLDLDDIEIFKRVHIAADRFPSVTNFTLFFDTISRSIQVSNS